MSFSLRKRETPSIDSVVTVTVNEDADENVFRGIRCPLCAWQPTPSSRWCCDASDAPEPFFQGCLTYWNTFTTRGLCPGCDHQWKWTSCLRCHGWSLEEEASRVPEGGPKNG